MNMNTMQQQYTPPANDMQLRKLHTKKSVVGHSSYKPISSVTFGGQLFSKKKQQFPTRRVYVCDIPLEAEFSDIKEAFQKHGEVTDIEECDSPSADESKSVFITFAHTDDALYVLNESMENMKVKEATVKVCEAVPKKSQIFVGGLRPETNEDDLVMFFNNYGTVCEAVLKTDGRTGLSRCFGFVTFVDSGKAVKDLLKNRFLEMEGKRIEVKPAVPMNQQSRMKRAQMAVAMNVASNQVSNVSKLTNRKMGQVNSSMYNTHGTLQQPQTTVPGMYGSLPQDYNKFVFRNQQAFVPQRRYQVPAQYRF